MGMDTMKDNVGDHHEDDWKGIEAHRISRLLSVRKPPGPLAHSRCAAVSRDSRRYGVHIHTYSLTL